MDQPRESGLWLPDPSLGECGYGFNTDYITGGKIAKVGEFPFMALLGLQQRNGKIIYGCGGTLINRRYVLTAAHCQSNKIPIRQVVLGETDTSKDRDCFDCPLVQRFTIRSSDVQVHEDYTPEGVFGQGNDIALIRLPSLAKTVYDSFDIKVGPACLPWKQEAVGDLRVIGWGRYSNNLGIIRKNLDRFSVNSNNLLYAELENIPYSRCRSFKEFERVHPTRHICAAGRNGGDSCNGDSGGPLIAHDRSRDVMYIKGIVSYGANACGKGTPGVYLNVREYLPWILSRLRD
ncbi:hypothetical protein TCAL_05922 [Tigriopus californicus]|uniref:Peptidase S1 domain-containing protein n=1 Tax=Tigriopus californicus TaxID=6832 RepID=A0A553NZE2_TIGCA|nr:hypothetical protein TCAL_05922 [Tigriopus californicus]